MRRTHSIGLDISDRSIRFAHLEGSKKGPHLKEWKNLVVPEGVIEDGIIREPRVLSTLLEKLMHGRDRHHREVIVSLPERQCFVKTITVHENHHPVNTRVMKEIQEDLPYELDEVLTDWQVMKRIQSGLTASFSILFVAAPKTIISAYEDALQNASLLPVALEVESLALARALLLWTGESSNVLIVDAGRSMTSLVLCAGDSIQLTIGTREFSGEKCTMEIAKHNSISPEEGEKMKKEFGITESNEKACIKSLESMREVLQTVLSYQESRSSDHAPIDHVILTGGSANMLGLNEYLAKTTGRDVALANPLANLSAGVSDPSIQHALLSYATAIGLALRAFQPADDRLTL